MPERVGERTSVPSVGRAGEREGESGTALQKLFWFGALWLAGVTAVSLVAWGIRSAIMP